ncbi:hypothetical protein Nocox_22030 [Nonomuraea coxensis DSM 45129]|uniref:Secreted protein n=1 Tax=Nonomuraea coxensis DSM 45129 TaxID=1122611 RepID=A0ABX8U2P0_9ACTN|nr:hypothetical protein Nocox_22030 [Nonomuraea coxensis DSM 45129]
MLLVIVSVVGTVFAHGGACAAVERAEGVSHGTAVESAGTAYRQPCLHRNLPPRHQHGTEQDCSAIGSAAAPILLLPQAALPVTAARALVEAASGPCGSGRAALPAPGNLCVMRL